MTPHPDLSPLSMAASEIHIQELKKRLMRVLLVFTVVCVPFIYEAPEWYTFISQWLHPGVSLISITVTAPFIIPLKLATMTAFLIILPYALFELWQFIKSALYPHERLLARLAFCVSPALFYVGVMFAVTLVCPLAFKFFHSVAPAHVQVTTDMLYYWSFVMNLSLAFGFSFQLPLLLWLLMHLNVVTPEQLSGMRAYVIVGAFVVGMLLTPPDVISQTLLAVPLWLMFEISLLLGRRSKRAALHTHQQP